jgi:hypothetical protein
MAAMISFLLFISFLFTVSCVEIEELTLKTSVIITPAEQICVPRHYLFLRGRIRYGHLYVELHRRRKIIGNTLGRYGTKAEPWASIGIRICSHSSKDRQGNCPLDSVIEIGREAARERQRAITAYKHMDQLLAQFEARWNANDLDYVIPDSTLSPTEVNKLTKWPAEKGPDQDSFNISLTTDTKPETDVFFPPADQQILATLDFLKDFQIQNADKDSAFIQLQQNVSSPAFIQQMGHVADQLELANKVLESLIRSTSDRLEKGLFPLYLFPLNTWLPAWFPDTRLEPIQNRSVINATVNISATAIQDDAGQDQLLPSTIRRRLTRYLLQLPTTTIRVHPNCDPITGLEVMSTHCVMDILTLLPKVSDIDTYTKQVFTAHPVPKFNPKDQIWQVVDVSNLPFVYQLDWTKQFFMALHPLKCFPTLPNWKCTVCTSERTLSYITDPCVMAILNHQVTDTTCPVQDTTNVDSIQFVHQANESSISDTPTNGSMLTDLILTSRRSPAIVQQCDTAETRFSLPAAARVRAQVSCSLKIENGPNVSLIIPNFRLRHDWHQQSSTDRSPGQMLNKFTDDALGIIRHHFQEFSFIYILSILGLIILVLIVKAICLIYGRCHVEASVSHSTDSLTRKRRPRLSVTFAPGDVASPLQASPLIPVRYGNASVL